MMACILTINGHDGFSKPELDYVGQKYVYLKATSPKEQVFTAVAGSAGSLSFAVTYRENWTCEVSV